jgi:ABC-2 type transport system permease protein/sodium transport system permease protein
MDPPHRSYSAFARVARLTRKELSEILRDRRTIVTLVAMPLLLYPLLSVAFLQFAWVGKADASRGAAYVFGFVGVEEAQVFLARFRQGDDELRRRQAKEGPDPQLDSRVATEPELQEALRAGMIDLLVRVPGAEKIASGAEDLAKGEAPFHLRGRDWSFKCELAYLVGSPGGMGALALVERRLAAADDIDLARRLNLRKSADPTVLLTPARVPVKGEGGDSFASLASLVPLILILMTITGAVYPAIDLTAGERERGTLEILVAAPVPRFELLMAKYLSVVTVAVLTAVANLVSMTITLQVSGLARQLLGGGGLSALLFVQVFALLLLFAAFFSAVLLSLTSFARSFKEAQAYLIPLMLGSLAPGVLAMMPGLTLRPELAVLPLINIVLLARDLFLGAADPVMAMLVVTTTLLYALAALGLAARVFGAESVLYSEQSGWSDLLRRPDESSSAPSIASALWCLALAVPIHFLAQHLLAQLGPPVWAQALLVAGLSVLLFALLPAAGAYLGRVRWAPGFGLNRPRPGAVLAGLVLGLSLWPLVLWLLQSVQPPAGSTQNEQVVEAMRRAQEEAGSFLLFATIVAAVTEELFFRGYLFSALRARSGGWVTVGVTAVLFGITHVFLGGALGLERLLPSTLLGLVLGLVCWLSGSVVPGLLLHVCHNTVLSLLASSGWASRQDVPPQWLAAGAVGTAVGLGVLLLLGRRRQQL